MNDQGFGLINVKPVLTQRVRVSPAWRPQHFLIAQRLNMLFANDFWNSIYNRSHNDKDWNFVVM